MALNSKPPKDNSTENNSPYLTMSDMMTGLMLIFLLVTIVLSIRLSRLEDSRKIINNLEYKLAQTQSKLDTTYKTFNQIQQNRTKIYNNLKQQIDSKFQQDQVSIDKDLCIKFATPILFPVGSAEIKPALKYTLSKLFPILFNSLLTKYRNDIVGIRIEGHTDRTGNYIDPYIGNLKLSSERATSILTYLRSTSYFKNLSQSNKDTLEFWVTANGMSYGHALDKFGQYYYYTGEDIDDDKSRRVQMCIITIDDTKLKKLTEKLQK